MIQLEYREKVRELWNANKYKTWQIAQKLHISESTVYEIIKGLTPHFSKEKFLEDMFTGNVVVDDLLRELEWVNCLNGRKCVEIPTPKRGKSAYKTKYYLLNKYESIDVKTPIKNEWIEWR